MAFYSDKLLSSLSRNKYLILRFYATKNQWKHLKSNTNVYDLSSNNRKTYLSVFGFAGTGALGIKHLIDGSRQSSNIRVARRAYPLYFFNNSQISKGVLADIKTVACGFGFTLFSGYSSKFGWCVFGCGINNSSQIGVQNAPKTSLGHQIIMEPKQINLPVRMNKITHLACGREHSVVVGNIDSTDGKDQVIYTFGNNQFGQCGRHVIHNEIYSDNCIVHRLNFPERIKQVECGEFNTYLLTETGSVFAVGINNSGQLGCVDTDISGYFLRIRGELDSRKVRQISCRSNTVLALTDDGSVWGWGDNQNSLLYSITNESAVASPTHLPMPDTVGNVVEVSAGSSVCGVVDENGQVHTWGTHILGLGPLTTASLLPQLVPTGLFGGGISVPNSPHSKVVKLKCGDSLCVAVTSYGCLYVWGKDCCSKGETQTFPVRLSLTSRAKDVFVGADHAIVFGHPF